MDSTTPNPVFPPELEQQIFLYALQIDPDNVTNLLLVAKRVHHWLIGPMHEVIIVHPRRTYPKGFTLNSLTKYRHHIRHLLFSYWATRPQTVPRAYRFIELCPNLENFAYSGSGITDQTLHDLYRLPIKRLTVSNAGRLRTADGFTPQAITFFSGITHFNMGVYGWYDAEIVKHFTALEYVAISDGSYTPALDVILEKVVGLKVLIWLSTYEGATGRQVFRGDVQGISDNRVVWLRCSYQSDWEDGARGKEDMWSFCEGVVKARQALAKPLALE